MYKCIIVEGPDNVGKDTVINTIKSIYSEHNKSIGNGDSLIYNIHFMKPAYPKYCTSVEDKIKWSFNYYKKIMVFYYKTIIDSELNRPLPDPIYPDCIVFNRSWLGELVYGPLYRGFESQKMKDWFTALDGAVVEELCNKYYHVTRETIVDIIYNKTLLLHLDAPTPFIARHDDGKSQSQNDMNLIETERRLFDQIGEFIQDNDIYKYYKLTMTEHNDSVPVWKDKDSTLPEELKSVLDV